MKIVDADVVWVPVCEYNQDKSNVGHVRVEHHDLNWQRTRGDFWEPAASAFNMPICDFA
jgi:hypothetical protein